MDAINKFFESEMCLYVIIGLFLLLLIIFIIILISNKKGKNNNSRDNNNYISAETKAFILEDEANTNSEIKIIQEKSVLPDIPVMEKKISETDITNMANTTNDSTLPLVDIPIPKVDDTPIDIMPQNKIVEENINDVQIQVERTMPVIENDPNPNEVIAISKELVVPETLSGEKNIEEQDIKEEVAVNLEESKNDIKTENVDFPDFSTLNENVHTIDTKDIEQEILATANQYINSIMSR